MKIAVAIIALATAPVAAAQSVAIVGGTIIDGTGGPPIDRGVVLIEGKRIVAVGPEATVSIPANAKTISASGKFVIPGLMDANVHLVIDAFPVTLVQYEGRYDELVVEAAQIALKNGVTTVFDSWGPRDPLIKARTAINEGRVTAARIYLAGNIVGFGGPFSDDFFAPGKTTMPEDFVARINAVWQHNVGPELMAMSPERVRAEIRKYVGTGIDFVKYGATKHGSVELQFSPRVQQVIVDEAHRAGITVQTHTMSGESLDIAVRAGVDMMQHCDITIGEPIPAETVALIAERRVGCAFLPHTARALAWYQGIADRLPFAKQLALGDINERALIQAGAVILLSTDAGVFSASTRNGRLYKSATPPYDDLLTIGDAHLLWLAAVEEKGMRPMDALRAATSNIARAYKVDRDLGTLERGKLADLVVLDRNPLEHAANYRSIHLIVKDGRVIDRDALPSRRLLTADSTGKH